MKKYSTEETQEIIKAVSESPYNLREAFRTVSTKINRTPDAISVKWYSDLSKQDKLFTIIGSRQKAKNSKNITPRNQYKLQPSIWQRLKNLFK